jgi:hypothetical protein
MPRREILQHEPKPDLLESGSTVRLP